jgi:hypothetical protein
MLWIIERKISLQIHELRTINTPTGWYVFNKTTFSAGATFTDREKEYMLGLVKKYPLKFDNYRLIHGTVLNNWQAPQELKLHYSTGPLAKSDDNLLRAFKSLQNRPIF